MTRRLVYGAALVAFVAAFAMTLTSIIIPRWISWNDNTSDVRVHYTWGLHRRCSSLTHSCEHFPLSQDCHGGDRYFCSMWRSTGFLMNFAVVIEGMTLIAFMVVLLGGKQKRDTGWKILSGLMVLVGALQCAGMALIAYLYDNDDRFFPGWKLDISWILCTVSWTIMMVLAGGISAAALLLPEEGGYELIPNES